MVRKKLIIPMLLLFTACVGGKPNPEHGVLHNLKITHVSELPPESGYLRTWIIIKGTRPNKEKRTFYLSYLGQEQGLPINGQVCNISFRKRAIDGVAALGVINNDEEKLVIDQADCA